MRNQNQMKNQVKERSWPKVPTRNDILLVFTTAVVITHAYTGIHLLRDIPSYIKKVDWWQTFSIASYHSIALLDALIVTAFFVIIATLLPSRFFQRSFGVQGSIMVAFASFFVASINKNLGIFRFASVGRFLMWAVIMLPVLIALTWLLTHPKLRIHNILRAIFERLQLLGWFYLALSGGIGAIVVLIRNIWGLLT